MEKLQLSFIKNDLDYYLNLTDIGHYHYQFAAAWYDYGWLNDPILTASDVLYTLVGDPDFGLCGTDIAQWTTTPNYSQR
jgi:hypothetical protein